MATINFPTVDLNNPATLTYTQAGITWTWNEPLGVWSSDLEGGSGGGVPGDGVSVEVGETAPGSPSDGDLWFCTAEAADGGGRLYVYYQDLTSNQWVDVSQPGTGIEYLSKTEDDTAAGQITFEGKTTHEAGVSVTGGDKTEIVNGFVNIPSNNAINIISDSDTVANFKQAEIGIGGLASAGRDVTIRNQYIDINETGLFVVKGGNGNGTHIGAITTQLNLTNNATATAYGLELTCSNINTGNSSSGDIYGAFVSSNLGAYTGSGKTYGYYSQLNTSARTTYAFFAAGTAPSYFAGATFVGSVNASINNDSGVQNGLVFAESGRIGCHATLDSTNDNNASFTMWKHGSNTGTFISFNFTSAVGNGGANLCGRIKGTGANSVNYEDTCDYRLKQNIQPLSSATDLIKQLKPSTFEYINEPGVTYQGFVAHEIQEVVPATTSGEKDEVDDNGDPVYQGVDQRRLIPYLTKALQEVIAENEDIKARLAALEGA